MLEVVGYHLNDDEVGYDKTDDEEVLEQCFDLCLMQILLEDIKIVLDVAQLLRGMERSSSYKNPSVSD